jgi:hypothetical protein
LPRRISFEWERILKSGQTIALDASVVAAKNQISSELDGEAVILDLDRGMYYGLDEVGARIWKLIQEPKSLSSVRDTLVGEFEVSPQRVEQDLLKLMEKLADAGLVSVSHAPE